MCRNGDAIQFSARVRALREFECEIGMRPE